MSNQKDRVTAESNDTSSVEPSDSSDDFVTRSTTSLAGPLDDNMLPTDSADSRWWFTNDLIAGALSASLVVAILGHGFGWLNLQTIPEGFMLLYSFAVGSAVAWAFGKDALEAWRGGE